MEILPSGGSLRRKGYFEDGQALLIVLLVMAVVLTITLSSVSRSITDVSISNYQEDSIRAFSAAEAGVEEAIVNIPSLVNVTPTPITLPNSSIYTVKVTTPATGTEFLYPEELLSGEVATIWFVPHDGNGNLSCTLGSSDCLTANKMKVCWGLEGTSASSSTTPAIEVEVYYDWNSVTSQTRNVFSATPTFEHVNVLRETLDPKDPTTRTPPSGFLQASSNPVCTIAGKRFQFSFNNFHFDSSVPGVNVPCYSTQGCILAVKLRMLYNSIQQPLGVSMTAQGGTNLPSQGYIIDSLGSTGSSSRRVRVFQGFSLAPSIFDSSIFSVGGITK